jgi:hypothetical protein
MLRALVVLTCVSAAVLAAPVPPPSEKELIARHWGKTEGQGEFELKGKQLLIRTFLRPDNGLIAVIGGGGEVTMPRAGRTVAGDFEMEVTVADAARPNRNAQHVDAWPRTRAGLFLEGGGYAIELYLYQYYTKQAADEEPSRCVFIDTWYPRGGSGSSLKSAEDGKSTHLRVTRKEKVVTVSYSFDGKEWAAPYTPRQELDFPDGVTVGVFFSHSTHQILEATFDRFTVGKPKDKKE